MRVPDDPGPAVKPVGTAAKPVLGPSPRPEAVLEVEAIRELLAHHHVVAGGGGGVALDSQLRPVPAVVDKDWVALELALAVDAAALVFATNVDHVYAQFGQPDAQPLPRLDPAGCADLLETGDLGAGSMRPKLAAAAAFVDATGRAAIVGLPGDIEAMLAGRAGTRIEPSGEGQ